MWQCENCGYTDEDGDTFETETGESEGDAVRYCPECGSDEVYLVEDDEDGDHEPDLDEEEDDSWDDDGGDADEDEEDW